MIMTTQPTLLSWDHVRHCPSLLPRSPERGAHQLLCGLGRSGGWQADLAWGLAADESQSRGCEPRRRSGHFWNSVSHF